MDNLRTATAPAPDYLQLADPLGDLWLVVVVAGAGLCAALVFWIAQKNRHDTIGNTYGALFVLALTMIIGISTSSHIAGAAQDRRLIGNIQTKYEVESVALSESDDIRGATVTLPSGETASYELTHDKATGEPFLDTGPTYPEPSTLEQQ